MDTDQDIKIDVASLGLFILDDFEWKDNSGKVFKRLENVIGGGGTYATVGARVWLPPDRCGMIVDRGTDWPDDVQKKLDSFGPMWYYRDPANHATTRAINIYTGQHRDFEYKNERLRLSLKDIEGTRLESAAYLHFVCSPTRMAEIIKERKSIQALNDAKFVYEPIPSSCKASELDNLKKILPDITILSPNHEEALAFFENNDDINTIEDAAFELAKHGPVIVSVRSGAKGSFTVVNTKIIQQAHLLCPVFTENEFYEGFWCEAFHRDAYKVKDVTGAGNAYLGGLAASLALEPHNISLAVLKANVAASFMLEQFGLPTLDEKTLWNTEDPYNRLLRYMRRVNYTAPPVL